jgi:ATP-binding cassette, subfamily B (MDR/TAP), member 1
MAISLTIASFIVGFTYSWKLSLVLVSVLPLILVGANLMVMALRTASVKNRQAYEKAGGIAEEIIYHIKTVASFANYEYEIQRFDEKLQDSLRAGVGGGLKSGLTMGFLYFLVFASYTLAVWFGSKLIYEKEYNSNTGKAFAAGDVLTVLFTIVFGAFSLGQAAPNVKAITEAMNAAYDFFELLQRVPQIKNGTEKPVKESLTGKISFEDVSFAYPAKIDKLVIDKLNLTMEPNKVTAIVGPSGSGKSTIVNLIERLYEVTSGVIHMDNVDLSKFDVTYLRSLIGYVPQEPVLFNTSIRDNIIFGRENITDEQVWAACKKAFADEFILKMDEKLDYIVGIKGSKLSGGQKQRIAIARAILTQPKILILDEATSALDNRSEKEVQKALNKVSKGVTTIVIAHRLSTIMHADKIVVLKDGKILEVGTHKSLLAENGIYAGLVRSQVGTADYNEELVEELEAEEKGLVIGEENAINNIEKEQTVPNEEKNMIDVNNIPKSTIKRKNSLEDLEEKIQADKKRKSEFEKLADSKKKKLWPILGEFKGIIFWAALSAAGIGAVWPAYGILLADSIDSLSKSNPEDVKQEGFLLAMYFLALAGGAGLSAFFQK